MHAKRPSLLAEASKPTPNSYGNNHGSTNLTGPAKIPYCYADVNDPGRRLSDVKTDRADGTSRHDLHPDMPAAQINRHRSQPLNDLPEKWSDAEKASY